MEGRIKRTYRYLTDDITLSAGWNTVFTMTLPNGFYMLDFKATIDNIEEDDQSTRSIEAGVFIGTSTEPIYLVGESSWSPESSSLTYTHLSLLGVPFSVYDTGGISFKVRVASYYPEYWVVKCEENTRVDIIQFASGKIVEF